MRRYDGPVYVVQIAQVGLHLGFDDDPEGSWVDQDVFLDQREAEELARTLESSTVWLDETGEDVTARVATVARVLTVTELEKEFGLDRAHRVQTAFRERLSELIRDATETPRDTPT